MRRVLLVLGVLLGLTLGLGLLWRLWIASTIDGKVTSWWRSPRKNKGVKGEPWSFHLIGLAWDLTPTNEYIHRALEAMGLTVVKERDHLHAQFSVLTPLKALGVV